MNSNMLSLEIAQFILIMYYVESFDLSFFHRPTKWIITPRPTITSPRYQWYNNPYECFWSPDWINCWARQKELIGTMPMYNTFKYQQYMQPTTVDYGMYPKFTSAIPSHNKLFQSIHPSHMHDKIVDKPKNNLLLSLPKSNLTIVTNINEGTTKPVKNVSNSGEITNTLAITQSTASESTTIYTTEEENSVIVPTTNTSSVTIYTTEEENSVVVPTTNTSNYVPSELNIDVQENNITLIEKFKEALGQMELKFYKATFTKLTSSNLGQQRQENAISFVQSGLFLQMFLMFISTQVDSETKAEIEECIEFNASDTDKANVIKDVLSDLPKSSNDLVFRWSSRLAMSSSIKISQEFRSGIVSALQLYIDYFNGTETAETRAEILNKKIEQDSKGAIHDTFDADDVSGTVSAVMLTTLYLRARWRSAPTVLNGTRPFYDAVDAPRRTVRMIRVNDVMRYAVMSDIDAEAIEVYYATPGLSLLILMPRGRSLRNLTSYVCDVGLHTIMGNMAKMRVAATLPIYTLRMTLLLPSKLQIVSGLVYYKDS